MKVAWPWPLVVAEPVDAGEIVELPVPWVSEMSFPAIDWGLAPWSFRVTVIVVLPPWGTEVLSAEMDELDAEAAGWAKVTSTVWVTVTLSVVSVAV